MKKIYCIKFSVTKLTDVIIAAGNEMPNLETWAKQFVYFEEFKNTYLEVTGDNIEGFLHTFGTIVLNAKADRVMSYGKLVSTYYHNNTIPNILEVHILYKDAYGN